MITLDEIKKQEEENIKKWRRDLHMIPELELELPQTVKYIETELDKMHIPYKKLLNNNAVVAIIESGKAGKTLAIRADMDALPITEETGLSFASKNGNMHACAHDGHMAMALGAAKFLNSNKDLFNGNVKIIFQPGEEYPGGAKPMIDEGALLNPKVDAIIGLHAGYINPEVAPGKIGIKTGPVMASMDRFYIKVIGKGGHGAYPYKLVDSIAISAEIITSLHKIISREISGLDSAVLSVTRIQGGCNQNIMPDSVEMEGSVRTTDERIRSYIEKRIKEISEGIAKCYNARAEVEYERKYPVLSNETKFTEFFEDIAKKVVGEDNVEILNRPIMGSEDMAFFLREVPGVFFFLSNPKDEKNPKSHHSSTFDINEDYLYMGTTLFINTALEYLK